MRKEQKEEVKNFLENLDNGLIKTKTQEAAQKIRFLNNEEQAQKKKDEERTDKLCKYYELIKARGGRFKEKEKVLNDDELKDFKTLHYKFNYEDLAKQKHYYITILESIQLYLNFTMENLIHQYIKNKRDLNELKAIINDNNFSFGFYYCQSDCYICTYLKNTVANIEKYKHYTRIFKSEYKNGWIEEIKPQELTPEYLENMKNKQMDYLKVFNTYILNIKEVKEHQEKLKQLQKKHDEELQEIQKKHDEEIKNIDTYGLYNIIL